MSVEAIRAAVVEVRHQVMAGHEQVRVARERLADAVTGLAELSAGHGGSLIPPEHGRADEQLAAALTLLAGSLEYLDRFVAGL